LEDSVGGIYKTAREQAIVHAAFGGTGFDFTPIRPRGSPISSSGGEACGPCAVLEFLNQSAHLIRQGGKREGANMGVLYDDHPDIDEFISYKDSRPYLKHFNISVGVHTGRVSSSDRDDLLWRIAEHSHATGDPGVLYVDRLNSSNLYMEELGCICTTNPCGEQPLRPYECCNLGSINLSKFVDPITRTIDYDALMDTVRTAIILLDRTIDVNIFPLEEIKNATLRSRKIGLGVMGWADALIKMGVSYQSREALDIIQHIGQKIQRTAHETSKELADIFGPHLFGKRRNENLITIAPTGTLSYLAGCSSGIEPNFGWDIVRETEAGKTTIKHPLYEEYVKGTALEKDTAHTVSAYWHIMHQATWQKYVDNAVSKTVNLPSTASVEDIYNVYTQANTLLCKGVTVYRDGSKNIQTLRTNGISEQTSRERPAKVFERKSGCGTIYVIPSKEPSNNDPWDTFAVTSGGCAANSAAIGRLISGWLQDHGTPEHIRRILHKVECPKCTQHSDGKSCADIIGNVLIEYYTNIQVDQRPQCPVCKQPLNFGSGCNQGECPTCGWSGCN
jgi:ribonucleoside-diphosphate reductase alpha chain